MNAYTAAQTETDPAEVVDAGRVFGVFSVVYLPQQAVTWNQIVGFALIAAGAFVFRAPLWAVRCVGPPAVLMGALSHPPERQWARGGVQDVASGAIRDSSRSPPCR